MREAIFIIVVALILLGLTLLRYRKQIVGLIEVGKVLKDVKDSAIDGNKIGQPPASVQLVNCAKCGVWVPQNKAIQQGGDRFYCSKDCATNAAARGSHKLC